MDKDPKWLKRYKNFISELSTLGLLEEALDQAEIAASECATGNDYTRADTARDAITERVKTMEEVILG
jgi:hypothetical protein